MFITSTCIITVFVYLIIRLWQSQVLEATLVIYCLYLLWSVFFNSHTLLNVFKSWKRKQRSNSSVGHKLHHYSTLMLTPVESGRSRSRIAAAYVCRDRTSAATPASPISVLSVERSAPVSRGVTTIFSIAKTGARWHVVEGFLSRTAYFTEHLK